MVAKRKAAAPVKPRPYIPQSLAATIERARARLQEAKIPLPVARRPEPPVIRSHPRDLIVAEGERATFSVSALVSPPTLFRTLYDLQIKALDLGPGAPLLCPLQSPLFLGSYSLLLVQLLHER